MLHSIELLCTLPQALHRHANVAPIRVAPIRACNPCAEQVAFRRVLAYLQHTQCVVGLAGYNGVLVVLAKDEFEPAMDRPSGFLHRSATDMTAASEGDELPLEASSELVAATGGCVLCAAQLLPTAVVFAGKLWKRAHNLLHRLSYFHPAGSPLPAPTQLSPRPSRHSPASPAAAPPLRTQLSIASPSGRHPSSASSCDDEPGLETSCAPGEQPWTSSLPLYAPSAERQRTCKAGVVLGATRCGADGT